ncbi:MAG: alpha/beta hydrolase [Bryobacteraceae bacterium]
MDHHYAQVNGIRLHYVSAGEGPLMIFLHGFPEFWFEWREQLAEFSKDHLAVAPDLRGFNLSEKPEGVANYKARVIVEDIRALADQLLGDSTRKFTLVAHDWGGAVAWAFALTHPDRLDRLIILNSPHPGVFARELRDNPAQQAASQYMLFFRSPKAEEVLSRENYRRLAAMVFGSWMSEEVRAAYLEAWAQPGALTGGLNYYRASPVAPPSVEHGILPDAFRTDPALFTVRVPTLVIWGEKDQALLVENLNGLEDYVPDLTVRRIPDGTHWIAHEHPDLVNRYIREYMAR